MDSQPNASSDVPSRRRFFNRVFNGLAAAIGAILGVPLAAFYAMPALRRPALLWKECGPLEDFPVGEVKLVPLKPLERREWPEDWGTEAAWVYRKSAGDFVVYNLHCTHVGCPVNWSPQARRFFSPCHGGAFDIDGRVLGGPPPRPLDRYDIKIENSVLFAGPVYRVTDQLTRLS